MTGPEAPDSTILEITLRALRQLLQLPPVQTSADSRPEPAPHAEDKAGARLPAPSRPDATE